MKHTIKITLILLGMFLIAQFIGLFVVNSYTPFQQEAINATTGLPENITVSQPLPYGMEPPPMEAKASLISILIAFAIAIMLILILARFKWKFLIRLWFFIVVILALAIAFNAILKNYTTSSTLIAIIIALPLATIKIYRPHILVHNFTELFIYPGIAAVFVAILDVWTVIVLLIFISIYDMWAVWHSGIMQKMAKFQMNELKIFGGFLVPYISKQVRQQIAKLSKSKSKKAKSAGVRIPIAILGGGDVVFPIIAAGVFLRAFGFVPALLVLLGAFAGLLFLLLISQKKKFYPAMPFITAGIFLGMLVSMII